MASLRLAATKLIEKMSLPPTVPNNLREPRSSSPSRRSRPLVDRTDGDDERGVPRLFELEVEGIGNSKPQKRRQSGLATTRDNATT